MKKNTLLKAIPVMVFTLLSTLFIQAQTFQITNTERIDINGGFGTGDGFSSFGGSIGFTSPNGFGFGLDVSRGNVENDFGDDIDGIEVSPVLFFDIINPNKTNNPLEVYGFTRYNFSNYPLDGTDVKIQNNGFSFGIGATYGLKTSEKFWVYPFAETFYVLNQVKIKDSVDSVTMDDNYMKFGVGVSGYIPITESQFFRMSPSLYFGNESTSFGLEFGIVLASF